MTDKNNINEYFLRITGSAYLNSPIDATKSVNIKDGEVSIYAVEKLDNQDGTFDIKYKGKFTSPITVEQGDKLIKGKDKRRWGNKFRALFYYKAQEEGIEDVDAYYDIWMSKIYNNFETIKELLKDK